MSSIAARLLQLHGIGQQERKNVVELQRKVFDKKACPKSCNGRRRRCCSFR